MTGQKTDPTTPRLVEGDPAAAAFVVVAFHTPDYVHKAERLAASCRAQGLACALYEIPAVHASISPTGVLDPQLTKPVLIGRALADFKKPVLYLDADMVVVDRPLQIEDAAGHADFAIYNWLADQWTDVWVPFADEMPGREPGEHRYFEFGYAIDYYDPNQLFCSGATQFWSTSEAARALLEEWRSEIEANPHVADDECLDMVFNNRDNSALTCLWLDKAYVRGPWWPHVKPVINHPDPAGTDLPDSIVDQIDRQRFYPERAEVRIPPPTAFPRVAVLDLQEGYLMQVKQGQLLRAEPIEHRFWS